MKKIITIIIILILVIGLGIYCVLNPHKCPWLAKIQDFITTKTQQDFAQDITAFVNTNPDSNIAMVIKAKNGEGIVAFTDENKALKKITLHTVDGKIALIQLNESGLPTRLDFEGTVATFDNYTNTTVDITVKRADGTTDVFKKSAISPKSLSFIPTALAYSISEYMSGLGTAMNVISCGVGLGTILFSAGASSPLAYMGCAALTTRILTVDANIGPCQGDVLDCAKDAILGSLVEATQEYGPDFLKKGFRLKGGIKNSITGSPVANGVIIVDSQSKKQKFRGEWQPKLYEIYLKDAGIYSARLVSEGFADSEFDIILASTKAQVRVPGKQLALEKDFGEEDYIEMEMDLFIDPDAFIRGEVIDAQEGMPIENATVTLLGDNDVMDTCITDKDGLFVIQPTLNQETKTFVIKISANGYKEQAILPLISFEVKDNSDEYDIPNWNGIAKMTPITGEEWVMHINYSSNANQTCKNTTTGYEGFVFSVNKDGTLSSEILAPKLKGNLKNGRLDLWFEGWSLEGEDGAKLLEFKGSLSGESGQGNWNKVVPEGIKKGEEHHYTNCGGTWTAEKSKLL